MKKVIISEDLINEILNKYKTGEISGYRLADEYNLSRTYIARLIKKHNVRTKRFLKKIKIINDYNTGKYKIIDLAKKYNLTFSSVSYHLKKNGIETKNTPVIITNKIINEIVHKYKNHLATCEDLAKNYGVCIARVRKVLRENNIKLRRSRKYSIDENYFSIIDSEEKAYFLGFLYADGCVTKNTMILGLQERDIDILIRLNSEIKSDRPIRIIKPPRKFWYRKNIARLEVCSEKFVQNLKSNGCVSRKSLTLTFPNKNIVPDHLLHHFVRGYFDGDGCISVNKFEPRNAMFYLFLVTSTENFCKSLSHILYEKLNVKLNIYDVIKNGITKNCQTGGRKKIFLIMEWLYNNATIFLERKHQIFINAKTEFETRNKLNEKK